ncbi:MAG: sulfatase-like hydrolase/transferase, partial [Anaerolineales bacterium]|nr:sulfatase-like hydrolase/transferase [Anaerolineales bacterium]
KRDLSTLTKFLNAFAIALLIFPVYQIISYQVKAVIADIDQRRAIAATSVVSLQQDQPAPDVYYILTDGYPRSDFITEYLGYDNTEFLDNLTSKGFYVAQCSQSNYTDTRFAMASTFNMIYLDNGTGLSEGVFPGSTLDSMIRSGTVQQNFSDLGYTVITLESGYKWLRWEDPDYHFDPAIERTRRQFLNFNINDFEKLLLDTTAAKLIIDIPFVLNPEQAKRLEEIINNPSASHRDRVFYSLKKIPEIAETISGPKFVYAHIIFPHPPFIVKPEANSLQNSPSTELTAYADQITYLNSRLIEIVDTLIEKSDPDPVIIIQSDHGATVDYKALGIDKSNRLGILNAYYLPPASIRTKSAGINSSGAGSTGDGQNTNLYSTITPVNTFRLIFDQYFNGNYGLLEDKSIIGRQSPFTTLDCTLEE